MAAIERLQSWYALQCDGDWEHQFGVKIETLDNPGWSFTIDLDDTSLEEKEFLSVRTERTDNDWLFASKKETKFQIACSLSNFDEALAIFCDWAGI